MKSFFRGLLFFVISFFPAQNFEYQSGEDGRNTSALSTDPDRTWSLVTSNTRSRLNQIVMFSDDNGLIVGRYLSVYKGKRWKFAELQPPVSRITKLFASSADRFWITYNNTSSESELYSFNGSKWSRVAHPMANAITAMVIADNSIQWMGGDREIVHREGNTWKDIHFPGSFGTVEYMFPDGEDKIWIMTNIGELYRYENGIWEQILKSEKVKQVYFTKFTHGFILAGNNLYECVNNRIKLHSHNKIFGQIKKLDFLPDGEIWGIGLNGLVLHFDKYMWHKLSIPTVEELTDIQMLSPNDGWIIGNNGTILHYTAAAQKKFSGNAMGFNSSKIIPVSKDINDEYGTAMEDLNNDGLKDIYTVCIYEPNRLYLNGSETDSSGNVKLMIFTEEAYARGANGVSGDSNTKNFSDLDLGVGLGDVDNDGDPDIYLCNLLGPNKLLINNGKGYFRNISSPDRGAGGKERTNAAVWGDVDNDGDLDLFVTNEDATNRLFLNDGNGYFTDITESSGLTSRYGGMGAAFADVDGDGKIDLCVSNWAVSNRMYRNVTASKGRVKFEDVTDKTDIGGAPFAKSNAVVFADIDNDGDLDLFITNRKRSNKLYLNEGGFEFRDITESAIGPDSMLSYGASFADFDQDGYQDLYVANVGENVLYKNIEGKKFIPVTSAFGAQMSGYSTGTACGDIDNDGDIDLYVSNYINGNSILFINNINNGSFIKFKVTGTKSNRDAVGASVSLYRAGKAGNKNFLAGFREISGGSGYASYNSREVHFGADTSLKYDAVVFFPATGVRKILSGISPGNVYIVNEEEGLAAYRTYMSKSLIRFFSDPDTHRETVKFIIPAVLIILSMFAGKKKYGWDNKHQIFFHGFLLALYWSEVFFFENDGFVLSTLLPVASVLLLLSTLHLYYERIIMVNINKAEKQATRDRIARDLHDDLASTLSSSVIYNEVLRLQLKNIQPELRELLNRIHLLLLEASDAVTDMVWTVSPAHDKMEDLLIRLRGFITDVCRTKGIAYNFDLDLSNLKISISDEFRRNVYLIFKEAVNNILKHSVAAHVKFSAGLNSNFVMLMLEDDGVGFSAGNNTGEGGEGLTPPPDTSQGLHGNGLYNMKRRSEEINGELAVESSPGKGTRIILKCKMT